MSTSNPTKIYVVHADPAVAAALASRPFEEHKLPDGVYRLRDAAAAIDKEQVAAALSARRGRPLLLIDLARDPGLSCTMICLRCGSACSPAEATAPD